ncbi:ubiquitin-like domain-containing protein CIP73 isoform X2 [Hibiscus syriacus]|nr:ubiquitin-like domain-containing protein CIP73 isoform X2 [Hibiscus syriacus]
MEMKFYFSLPVLGDCSCQIAMADQHSNEGSVLDNIFGESSNAIVELKVKTLDSQICSLHVEKNTPVSLFKERIANAIGFPVGQQRLIFRGKVLKDDHLLSEYHVEDGDTLHLVERQPAQSQPSSETSSGETNGNNSNRDVEDGDTLHLVERQPAQSQPSSETSSGETNGNNSNRGSDASAGIPPNHFGQILHSVVLGTLNVGDQGEGIVPELTRVLGAVLNSFGVGSQPTATSTTSQFSTFAPQGNSTDGVRGGRPGGENQAGIQIPSAQSFPGQSFQVDPQFIPIPLNAAPIPVPSLNTPIPDSLNTLSDFMDHMEAHSPNGYQPHMSTTNRREQPRVVLPTDARGLPTPEALSIVMRHAERLLSSHAIVALSHIAGCLEQERDSTDPAPRGQIQSESTQVGLTMQHLGALLLELGRTILTLRMGNSPDESSVNAGPAVYISPSRPNPIMVQPFPLQTNSLFSSSSSPSNALNIGPIGIGNAQRHINIHIHAGTALAPVVSAVGNRTSNEGVQGELGNNGSSGPMRVLPMQNIIAAGRPAHSTGVVSSAAQSASNDSSLSSALVEVNSRLRDLVSNVQGQNQVVSGNDAGTGQPDNMTASGAGDSSVALPADLRETEEQKSQRQHDEHSNNATKSGKSSKDVSTGTVGCLPSSSGEFLVNSENSSASVLRSTEENAKPVPLGLGLGGLERKRRVNQAKSSLSTGNTGIIRSHDQSSSARMICQKILQSLTSPSSSVDRVGDDASSSNPGVQSRSSGVRTSDDQLDVANAVSQVLESPVINGLLAGVSEQTGVGSPDVLRNMLQQLTRSPQIMNTVNQLAQQVDSQDIGNMFSGLGVQGGGIDMSRTVQQMMPIVSRALSQGASAPLPFHAVEPKPQVHHDGRKSNAANYPCDSDFQDNVRQIAQRIEEFNSPCDVFHAVAENAVQVYGNGRNTELLSELCGDEDLAEEYVEMLHQDIRQRFQDKYEDKC